MSTFSGQKFYKYIDILYLELFNAIEIITIKY